MATLDSKTHVARTGCAAARRDAALYGPEIAGGDTYGLLGPKGAGKSTIISMVAVLEVRALQNPTSEG